MFSVVFPILGSQGYFVFPKCFTVRHFKRKEWKGAFKKILFIALLLITLGCFTFFLTIPVLSRWLNINTSCALLIKYSPYVLIIPQISLRATPGNHYIWCNFTATASLYTAPFTTWAKPDIFHVHPLWAAPYRGELTELKRLVEQIFTPILTVVAELPIANDKSNNVLGIILNGGGKALLPNTKYAW